MALETPTILKLLIVLGFLLDACYTDLRYRKVSNKVWFWMLISCSWFVVIELLDGGLPYLANLLLSVAIMIVFVTKMYSSGSIGGGDAKGLLALAVLFPFYPTGEIAGITLPVLGTTPLHLFPLTVLLNTFFVSISAPLGLAIYNMIHFEPEMLQNPAFMAQGYRTTLEKLEKKEHTVPLECIGECTDLNQKVWVTPLLPYMIFITIGYIAALLTGDFLYVGIMWLI